MFSYNKLSGKITEKFGTRVEFSRAMGWSERTMSLKMNGKRDWKQCEIYKAVKLLGIRPSEIPQYFFDLKVQSVELISQSQPASVANVD